MYTSRSKDTRPRIFEFILRYQEANGTFPAVREIQKEMGFGSPNAVTRHLVALEKEGHLRRVEGKARTFEIRNHKMLKIKRIPLLGSIPAGLPESAYTQPEEMVAIDLSQCPVSDLHRAFALRVHGHSMVGASIRDGDLAIFEDREAGVGDIVAALVDGQVTLKRLARCDSVLVLKAENPDHPDIKPKAELQAQGVLIGIQRKVA